MATDLDVAVVGAGHNGLAAAAYLAGAGLSVAVFERGETAGGAALTQELWPGYRFSTCAHLVHSLPPRIARELELFRHGLEIIPRTAGTVRFHADETYDADFDLDLPGNRLARARLSEEEKRGLERYLDFRSRFYEILSPFTLGPPPTLDQLRRQVAGTPGEAILRTVTDKRLWELQDGFLPSERLRDFFSAEGSAVACDPQAFALARGVIDEPLHGTAEPALNGYVRGGMGNLSRAIARSAEARGVKVRTGAAVERILTGGGRAVGLRLAGGEEIRARAVLSSADPKTTFLRLLPSGAVEAGLRTRIGNLLTHVSCLKLFAALSELPRWKHWEGDPDYPSQGCAQIGVTRQGLVQAYADLEAGRPPRRPVISFNLPSIRDPSLAPPGHHTASCFIYPAPARLKGGSWDDVREEVTESLIGQINELAPNFRRSIVHVRIRTPLDLEREQALPDGCIWHIQHTADQLYGSRPLPELAAYRAPLPGLYLGGSGQHPGGEVSGIPGRNAAMEILKDFGVETK